MLHRGPSASAAAALACAVLATPAAGSDALNGRIAYTTHGLDGTGEIATIDPDGSDWLRLTDTAGTTRSPTSRPTARRSCSAAARR